MWKTMKQELLLMVMISYAVAQIVLKPIRLANVESMMDLRHRLKEAGDKLVVIGFMPRACPESVKIAPQIEKLAQAYANTVVFLRVFEDHDDIYSMYNVKSVPTFVYVRRNQPTNRVGGTNIKDILKMIEVVKTEHNVLSSHTSNTTSLNAAVASEKQGLLYDIECYDDLKGRLTEAKDKLVVLSFLPNYCSHSYSMVPLVQKLAMKYSLTTTFLRIREEQDDIYEVFDIQSVPTFIFMRNKKKILVKSGAGAKLLAATVESILTGDYTSTTTTTQEVIKMTYVINVSGPEELEQRLKAAESKLVIMAFLTNWCSKCQSIAPKIENMADEYSASVVFLKIDDQAKNKELYQKWQIARVPTFVFVKNKKKIHQYEGTTYEKIRTRIELQDFLNL